MPTLLVTVIGPQRHMDLELPDDVPMNTLIPALLTIDALSFRAHGADPATPSPAHAESATWCLRLVHESAPLLRERTLQEADVPDGAVLVLQDAASWTSLHELAPSPFTPRTIAPAPDTGGIGVSWSKEEL